MDFSNRGEALPLSWTMYRVSDGGGGTGGPDVDENVFADAFVDVDVNPVLVDVL